MTDRPAILSAKLDRHAAVVADADRLKAMDQTDRPNEAPLDDVRTAYADAMDDLCGCKGSVAAVDQVPLPTDRLEGT